MTTAWNWMTSLFGRTRSTTATPANRRRAPRFVPSFLTLEQRETPTVNVIGGFEGLRQGDPGTGGSPPDTDSAVGPSAIMETVKVTARLTTKDGALLSTIDLNTMFPVATAGGSLFDPNVIYDDNSQRFFLVVLEVDVAAFTSFLHVAVSNTSTPTDLATDFTEKATVDMFQLNPDPAGTVVFSDFPRIACNEDGFFVTTNQFDFITGARAATLLTTFRKSTLLDANPATLRFFPKNLTVEDFTLVPVQMHQAPLGAPMLFVGTVGFNLTPGASSTQIQVKQVTDYFTINPAIRTTQLNVANYNNGFTPAASQPFTGVIPNLLITNDTSLLDAGWRDGRIATAGNANLNGAAKVRWYEIAAPANLTIPRLLQQGTIDPGNGVSAFLPAIDIAQNLDIGITYMQTSPNEFLSIYVTGRTQTDARGTMQNPVRVREGEGIMFFPGGDRTGDYAGIGVDPLRPNTFVIANEYASSDPSPGNWATWVSTFTVSPPLPNPIKTFSPLRWAFDRATNTFNGNMTVLNTTTTITGNLTLTLTLPDISVQVITPAGTRVGNTYTLSVAGPFVQNAPLRIAIRLTNPNKFALGSIQLGVVTSIS